MIQINFLLVTKKMSKTKNEFEKLQKEFPPEIHIVSTIDEDLCENESSQVQSLMKQSNEDKTWYPMTSYSWTRSP